MTKKWYAIRAQADQKPPQVAIRGMIGDFGVTDSQFIADVQALGSLSALDVVINSIGGDASMALGIFNFLRGLNIDIAVRVEGVALSSGSIIAMAASPGKLIMPANTLMMAHKPWTYAAGNADQLRQVAADLDIWTQALIQTYVARTRMSAEQLDAFLAEERTMTAEEAVKLGFADVVESLSPDVSARASMSHSIMACALGLPAEVLAKVQSIEQGLVPNPASSTLATSTATPTAAPAPQRSLHAQVLAEATTAGLEKYALVFSLASSTLEEARTRMHTASEILALSRDAGYPDLGEQLVMAGATRMQACERITRARAEAADLLITDGHLPTPSTQSAHTPHTPEPQAAVTTANIWAAHAQRK